MSANCELYPTVKKDGAIKTSKLASDLLKKTGDRDKASSIYNRYLSFRDKEHLFDENELDENGQPKLEALLKTDLISKNPKTQDLACDLVERISGFSDEKGKVKLRMNRQERGYAMSRVSEFNSSSEFKDKYVATVSDHYAEESHPGGWKAANSEDYVTIDIKPKTLANERDARNQMASNSLNEKIRSQMAEMGIQDGALFDYEERRKMNGVTDFSVARDTAHGMATMIRIAKGGRGEGALPEEFSHLTVRAMEGMPIRDRFVNVIKNNNLSDIILGEKADEYHEYYNGDEDMIAEEAAGQLVQAALVGKEGMEIPEALSPMLARMMKMIGETYSKGDADKMTTSIYEAVKIANDLSSKIMDFDFIKSIKENKIEMGVKMAQLSKDVKKLDMDIEFNKRPLMDKLKTIMAEESKVDSLLKKANTSRGEKKIKNDTLDEIERQRIANAGAAKAELEDAIEKHDNAQGVTATIGRIIGDIDGTLKTFDALCDPEKAVGLTEAKMCELTHRSYVMADSYDYALDVIHDELVKEENRFPKDVQAKLQKQIEQTGGLLKTLKQRIRERQVLSSELFFKQYKEGKTYIFGDVKARELSCDEYLNGLGRDISFYDALLRSSANSNNPIVRAIDDYIKVAYHKSRMKSLDDANKVIDVFHNHPSLTNFDFMYEFDEKGVPTGKYVSKYDMDKFYKTREEFLNGDESFDKKKQFEDIYTEDGHPLDSFISHSYSRLTPEQKQFHDEIMAIKQEFDDQLTPGSTTLDNAIKIRKDTIERVFKDHENLLTASKEALRDAIMVRADDIEYDTSRIKTTLTGRQIVGLPINYVHTKEGEDLNGMSRDLFSTMIAYGAMANNFKYKAEIADRIEVVKDRMESMQFRESNNLLMKSISYARRQVAEDGKLSLRTEKIETGTGKDFGLTKLKNRIDKELLMELYGIYSDKDNDFKVGDTNISMNKLGNLIVKHTALSSLCLNFLNDSINVTTGSIAMNIEAMGGENFTYMENKKALLEYSKEIGSLMYDVGHWEKNSKLALINRVYDVMQDYDEEITDIKYDRKSEMGRKLGKASILFGNRAGEHFLQHRTAIACMLHYKMKDKDGSEISLYDALTTKPRDPAHPEKGSELVLKDGVTKMDGTKWEQKDIIKMSRKIASINQSMHGIYNKMDRAAAQYYMLGKFAFQFKKYFIPQWDKRFAAAKYNADLDTDTEGYHMTTLGFLNNIRKESKGLTLDIATQWHKLDKRQQSNVKKSIADVSYIFALGMTAGILYNLVASRKNNPWALKFAEYQAVKLYTDHVVFLPVIGMTNLQATIGDRASAFGTLKDWGTLPDAMSPTKWNESAGGLFEGHSKGFRAGAKIFAKPAVNILRFSDPQPSIDFAISNNTTFGVLDKTQATREQAKKNGYEKAKETRAANKAKKEQAKKDDANTDLE